MTSPQDRTSLLVRRASRALGILPLLPLSLLAVAACGREPASAIQLAAVGPWSRGTNALQLDGARLAIAEVNAAGGIRGRKLAVVALDDRGDPERAVDVAKRVVENDTIVAVLGHVNSSTSLAAGRVYEGRIAAVSATASSPDLTGFSSWFFRVVGSDAGTGRQLAALVDALGWERMLLLYENDSYGRGLATSFTEGYRGALVGTDPIDASVRDFTPYLEVARRRGATAVFIATSEDLGLAVLRDVAKGRFGMTVLGSDGWAGSASNPAFDRVVLGLPFVADGGSERATRFAKAYRAAYGKEPDAAAALAYDAALLVARALAADPTRDGVRDYLRTVATRTPLEGATGSIKLGANGDPEPRPLVRAVIRGGSLRRY